MNIKHQSSITNNGSPITDTITDPSAVFFEVRVDEAEDLFEVAHRISAMGCSTVIEVARRVIKVWPNREHPNLGYI